MPKGRPFQELLLKQLANPEIAKHYLNEALDESPESFLTALKTVARARQMARVARDAGVQRETLYRSLSSQGNPTLDTLSSILKAVGLKIFIVTEEEEMNVAPSPPASVTVDLSAPARAVHIFVEPISQAGYATLSPAGSILTTMTILAGNVAGESQLLSSSSSNAEGAVGPSHLHPTYANRIDGGVRIAR